MQVKPLQKSILFLTQILKAVQKLFQFSFTYGTVNHFTLSLGFLNIFQDTSIISEHFYHMATVFKLLIRKGENVSVQGECEFQCLVF